MAAVAISSQKLTWLSIPFAELTVVHCVKIADLENVVIERIIVQISRS
jgi:hypothetical protein